MITGLLNEREVAEFLKLSLPTLRRWRAAKTGPKFVRFGASIRYDSRDLMAWLELQKVAA